MKSEGESRESFFLWYDVQFAQLDCSRCSSTYVYNMCIWVGAGIALQGLITQVYMNKIMRMVSQSSILKLRAASILEPQDPSPTHSHART